MPHNLKHKSVVAQKEEEILSFWNKRNIFKKSLEKKSPEGEFVFYDGPPFATGLPHYGHLLASVIKDVIPRYKTMRGYHVRRVWGWDCHGLPVENLIETELGLERKKDIEKLGIEQFNRAARNSVLRYDSEWKKIIPRIGRWVDMESGYRTMDAEYTESIWWAFKTLYEKNLIYEGYKSMHICPRCETTLAASEVQMGYKDITDISVIVKFELTDEPGTYLLAWTTTAWTVPGNVAVAINKDFNYVKIGIRNRESGIMNYYIVAKERLSIIKDKYEIVLEFKGSELVGKTYKPIFNYYTDVLVLKNKENGWKIYPADFVSSEDGTGIVHIAPAFGENDMELGKQYDLPFIQHVSFDGTFKPEVVDMAGLAVKPKHDHQATDILIIKHLARRNLLFKKEKITHSYPFCWRCDTPLLNYAASSWFVKVIALKQKLLDANKKIQWIPASARLGRFGKWLEGARDWAISRSRFWGAPIPVWKCELCKRLKIVGGAEDIKKNTLNSGNKYIVMRHAEAENNALSIINSSIDERYGLTEKGKKTARAAASSLKKRSIDFIIASPFPRTLETARIVAERLGFKNECVIIDTRLREIETGEFDSKTVESYHGYFFSTREKFTKRPEGGENLLDVKKRVGELLYEIETKYKNKTILFITHDFPAWQMFSVAEGWNVEKALRMKNFKNDFIKNAEARELPYYQLPRNSDYELDFHRPFVDRVELICRCGNVMKRVPEVFDCWFESGSMPFAQFHYPFENQKVFKKNFPAHFIAEGLDQTRGWFYNMLVISAGLFGKSAYNTAIMTGLILAEDGQKMSKKLKNYPDPAAIINEYGADAMRYYLLSSPVVRGEYLNFSEKDAREVMSKVITRLRNVNTFYDLYNDKNLQSAICKSQPYTNVLDQWIRIRLSELINKVTCAIETYEIDKAMRSIGDFIEDLSTWYIRRSRERFKGKDKKDAGDALTTTRFVLTELARIMAPFTPFIADEIYRNVTAGKNIESVHLSSWPNEEPSVSAIWPSLTAFLHRLFGTHEDLRILSDMARVREIVSLAFDARMKEKIKTRQPLGELRVKKQELRIKNNEQLIDLIKNEVNVKNIVFGANIEQDVELDTRLTEELKQEGNMREFIRYIQDLRKKEGLLQTQKIDLIVQTDAVGRSFIEMFESELKKSVSLKTISFSSADGEKTTINGISFVVKLKR